METDSTPTNKSSRLQAQVNTNATAANRTLVKCLILQCLCSTCRKGILNMQKNKILLILTGGTICSTENENGERTSTAEKAQTKIENNNYGIRKNLLEYDRVNNEQREIIYEERRRVLDGESMRDSIFHMMNEFVENQVDMSISPDLDPEDWDLDALNASVCSTIPMKPVTKEEAQGIKHYLVDFVSPDQRYTVSDFKKDAEAAFQQNLF